MKKVGLITINDIQNFGNRLQNYALQQFLKSLSVDVENIVDNTYYDLYPNLNILCLLKMVIRTPFHIKKSLDRISKFKKFNNNIIYSKYTINNNYFNSDINKSYKYFIVGSDQVWNPSFAISDVMLLTNMSGKKISYAASFGVSQLEPENVTYYKTNLEKFDYISTRENAGKNIVESITKRKDIEVVIDPTMLLTSKEWDKVSIYPQQMDRFKNKKYILNYFLGNLSKQRKKEIQRIAKKNDCFIINILDKRDPFYTSGPGEFLWLEKNAFLICTDSYHSSVFAIIYNRPFIIFDREDHEVNMNSRIETLLNKFDLTNRKYNNKITKENLDYDYSEAYKILAKERQKSSDFLKKALNIKEVNKSE